MTLNNNKRRLGHLIGWIIIRNIDPKVRIENIDRTGQCCRLDTSMTALPQSAATPYSSYACPPLSLILHHLPGIALSTVPYLLFLAIYAINPHLHILLTSEDAATAQLRNVSAWESKVVPFSTHRFISSMNCTVLDVVSTVPYMMHYIIPVLFPVYLAITDRWHGIPRFYRLLGVAMWGHYFIWYLLPTAPPWAYAYLTAPDVGSMAAGARHLSTVPSGQPVVDLSHREGAAFARVDSYTGYPFFYNMFSGNPVPFAAFPSGHVTWPMCIFMIGPPGGRARFAFYVLLVIWATLYSSHHYLFDALGAILLVLATHNLIEWWANVPPVAPITTPIGLLRQLWRMLHVFKWRRTANEHKTSNGKVSNGKVPHMNGINGKNGINGLNGLNGINGLNGLNGINGMNEHAKSYDYSDSADRLLPV